MGKKICIDTEALAKAGLVLARIDPINCVVKTVPWSSCPHVDEKEEVHGRWGEKILAGGLGEEWGYVCSECRCTVSEKSRLGKYQGRNQQLNYCPNCGAKMDGGAGCGKT